MPPKDKPETMPVTTIFSISDLIRKQCNYNNNTAKNQPKIQIHIKKFEPIPTQGKKKI